MKIPFYKMTTPENQTTMAFKAISGFINSLSDMFGEENMGLLLYNHLLSKTKQEHTSSIEKHINIFRKFCISNRDAIMTEKIEDIEDGIISYSEKVQFDLKHVFSKSDKATQNILWRHILTISALVDPTGKAKQILKDKKDAGNETNFLSGFLDKIESSVNPDANPLEALGSVMSSGVLNDLIGEVGNGMKDGSLDMEKLVGSAQDIVSGMTGKDIDFKKVMEPLSKDMDENPGKPPDFAKMMSGILGPESGEIGEMMNSILSGGKDGEPPDFAKMMSGMMGGAQGGDAPDFAKMMSGMMGGAQGGDAPDFAKMMSGMMEQLSEKKPLLEIQDSSKSKSGNNKKKKNKGKKK
jgi:hypothetical protein